MTGGARDDDPRVRRARAYDQALTRRLFDADVRSRRARRGAPPVARLVSVAAVIELRAAIDAVLDEAVS